MRRERELSAFREFADRKTHVAATAAIHRLRTIAGPEGPAYAQRPAEAGRHARESTWLAIGNNWTRQYYDGDFLLAPAPPDLPAISLVFVQSRDGNTGAANPDTLGGGPTDKHLIYEGLSRVAADAVMSGASTAAGRDIFFSVWHPELVDLRASLGLPRHPAQIVISKDGNLDLDRARLFNVPDARVYVLAGSGCRVRCEAAFGRRPWITRIPLDDGLAAALEVLRRDHGLMRISCVGGRTTATHLIDRGLVHDLCLTTAARDGGDPGTPFYAGDAPPRFDLIIRKQEQAAIDPILFEHLAVNYTHTSPWK